MSETSQDKRPSVDRVFVELRRFIESRLRRYERMEANAMKGGHEREQARNNGRASALEIVLSKIDELDRKTDGENWENCRDCEGKGWTIRWGTQCICSGCGGTGYWPK